MEKKKKKTITNTQTYFKLNYVQYKEIDSIYINPRSQFIIENNLNISCKNMEIVKYGSLMHGWWVGVWLVASSQQLYFDFQPAFHALNDVFLLGDLHDSCR